MCRTNRMAFSVGLKIWFFEIKLNPLDFNISFNGGRVNTLTRLQELLFLHDYYKEQYPFYFNAREKTRLENLFSSVLVM